MPPHPILKLCLLGLLILALIMMNIIVICFNEERHNAKDLQSKVISFLKQLSMLFMLIDSLMLLVTCMFKINQPMQKILISPRAPRIEKAAIRQIHQEYPYTLTIKSNDDINGIVYLLKQKPHKAIAGLYKLKFTSKDTPYVKHIGYRSLTATQSYSVENSTKYFQYEVTKRGTANWQQPNKQIWGALGDD